PRFATRIPSWWTDGRRTRSSTETSGRDRARDHRAGPYVCIGHRQDQLDCVATSGAVGVVARAGDFVLACHAVVVRSHVFTRSWRRRLGNQYSDRLGLRDCQFRMVDWHWARRHTDLSDTLTASPGMANLDQPLCRSDDALRRSLRRIISFAAHGQAVVLLLA